jgi:hypothetical protein
MMTTWYVSVEWLMTVVVAPILVLLLSEYGASALIVPKVLIGLSSTYAFIQSYSMRFVTGDYIM